MQKLIKTLTNEVSPHINSGESVTIVTKIYDNGDQVHGLPVGIFFNQEIVLQSYGNSASISLYGNTLTPSFLRQLANDIDSAIASAAFPKSKKTKK